MADWQVERAGSAEELSALAGPDDVSLCVEWLIGFGVETALPQTPEQARRAVPHRVADGTLLLWQDPAALAAGADRVMLYTDLANPVSNAVYARLGYVPVGDAAILVFGRS